jgi:hypothetical protein
MSLFTTSNVTCPACGSVVQMKAAGSINADRRPDLRDAILNDSFQIVACGNCGLSFRLEPEFNYLDVGRGQWLAALPARRIADLAAAEAETQQVFDASYGPAARPAAQEVGRLLQLRLTFGWPGTKEKLLLRALDLDDVIVEMTKLDLMRRLPSAPLVEFVELRVMGLADGVIQFAFVNAETEEVQQTFGANRQLYDDIAAQPGPWAAMRARLTAGPFVDMQRLYQTVPA